MGLGKSNDKAGGMNVGSFLPQIEDFVPQNMHHAAASLEPNHHQQAYHLEETCITVLKMFTFSAAVTRHPNLRLWPYHSSEVTELRLPGLWILSPIFFTRSQALLQLRLTPLLFARHGHGPDPEY